MTWRPPGGALGEIVAEVREECEARRRNRPGLAMEVLRKRHSSPGRFRSALANSRLPGFPLICELKRASPSAGTIRTDVDVPALARAYVEAGARCLSVLTESRRFGGSLQDLRAARAAVTVPLLRKDFTVDPYMVYEASDAGADCVLLIAAAVEPAALLELAAAAEGIGLDVLLEIIYTRDLPVLALREWPLVGINARDLETLEVDPGRFEALAGSVHHPGRLLVAESGIRTPQDIERVKRHGAAAALIGEALMRREDPGSLIRALTDAGRADVS